MKKYFILDKKLFIYLSIFFIISITSIYSFSFFITNDNELIFKQIIFYLFGIILIFIINKIRIKVISKYSYLIYIFNVFLLILVLFIGNEINGVRAWFSVPLFNSLQPSEFMKIGIVLVIANLINKFDSQKTSFRDEIKLIIKIGIVILIPSVLTFLEPDTGAVVIYFIIALVMIFISDINKFWFILAIGIFIFLVGSVIYLYFFNTNLFIEVLGSNFFYRLDRILNWVNSSGMQLENSIVAIGSSNIFGNGISNILIYFPEGHTDFIFTSFASIYGLFGIAILIITIILFDLRILNISKNKPTIDKYIIIGFLSSIIFQQVQNIAMTIGIVPIMGITLPFISYGGSSLISYMIILGIILAIKKG